MSKQEKYLIIFLTDISFCTNSVINIEDQTFKDYLIGFINNYYPTKHKLIDKIFDLKIENNKGTVNLDFNNILEYGLLFNFNPQAYIRILDEIGYKDTDELLSLAELFTKYVDEVSSIGVRKVKKYERRKRNNHE